MALAAAQSLAALADAVMAPLPTKKTKNHKKKPQAAHDSPLGPDEIVLLLRDVWWLDITGSIPGACGWQPLSQKA
jgi:hypothetical protein